MRNDSTINIDYLNCTYSVVARNSIRNYTIKEKKNVDESSVERNLILKVFAVHALVRNNGNGFYVQCELSISNRH